MVTLFGTVLKLVSVTVAIRKPTARHMRTMLRIITIRLSYEPAGQRGVRYRRKSCAESGQWAKVTSSRIIVNWLAISPSRVISLSA